MNPEILVPLLMGCALLWWLGRDMTWTNRLVVTAITLSIIVGILWFEGSGHQ